MTSRSKEDIETAWQVMDATINAERTGFFIVTDAATKAHAECVWKKHCQQNGIVYAVFAAGGEKKKRRGKPLSPEHRAAIGNALRGKKRGPYKKRGAAEKDQPRAPEKSNRSDSPNGRHATYTSGRVDSGK